MLMYVEFIISVNLELTLISNQEYMLWWMLGVEQVDQKYAKYHQIVKPILYKTKIKLDSMTTKFDGMA